jgi:Short C-terminal domain
MLRRRPVARTVARTAVVAGTATVVAGGVAAHQAAKNAPQAPVDEAPVDEAPVDEAPPETTGPPPADPMEQLSKLGELKERGILTEEEFATQKAKILSQM